MSLAPEEITARRFCMRGHDTTPLSIAQSSDYSSRHIGLPLCTYLFGADFLNLILNSNVYLYVALGSTGQLFRPRHVSHASNLNHHRLVCYLRAA